MRSRRTVAWMTRGVLLLGGLSIAGQAAQLLRGGEPDYLNFFHQPVSAVVALVVGLALVVAALVPWSWLGASWDDSKSPRKARGARRRSAERTEGRELGRNDPCHCGSGRKYKKCCLRADEKRRRAARMDQMSAALNRSNSVVSSSGMADRGLKGR